MKRRRRKPTLRELHRAYVASLTDEQLTDGCEQWPKDERPPNRWTTTWLQRDPLDDLEPIIYPADGDEPVPTVGNDGEERSDIPHVGNWLGWGG